MADRQLSAKEALLIAQARAELQQATAAQPAPEAPAERPQRLASPAAATPLVQAMPATGAAAEERIAALMAAARADTERARRRRKLLYVWLPFAFMAISGIWTLVWMWSTL